MGAAGTTVPFLRFGGASVGVLLQGDEDNLSIYVKRIEEKGNKSTELVKTTRVQDSQMIWNQVREDERIGEPE